MTENRGQPKDTKRHGRTPSGGIGLLPCALSLVPFFKENPVAGAREPAASNGFTLLEVMVAMSIMAIVLVSVYRMHSQTLAMNTATRFYTQAPMLAQSKLAQLETGGSEIITGDSGDFGDKYPGYSWNVTVEEVAIEALGEVANDLKQINLTVSFNDNEYAYTVRTYRLFRE